MNKIYSFTRMNLERGSQDENIFLSKNFRVNGKIKVSPELDGRKTK